MSAKHRIKAKINGRASADLQAAAASPREEQRQRSAPVTAPVASTRRPAATSVITPAVIEKWQRGARLADLAVETGLKRSKFRRLLTAALGGKTAFQAARADGAGGRRREKGQRSAPRVDDAGVKRLHSTKGWTCRRLWEPTVVTLKLKDGEGKRQEVKANWRELKETVFISRKGNEYVYAADYEPADLIIEHTGFPPIRLKKFKGSAQEKRMTAAATEAAEQAERGQAALERTRARKRAARLARRAKRAHRHAER